MAMERRGCLVIMPFGKTTDEHTEDYWTKHFKDFLKPLIEENPEVEARRSEPLRGDILAQIITALVVSRVVVADLTDHNPNVYWELGVRQSFKHGTIMIAEAGMGFPFDIGTEAILSYYPKNHLKMSEFRKRFKQAVRDCLANPDRPDSHVLETLSGRGTLFEIFRRDEAMRRLSAVLRELAANSDILEDVLKTAKANQEHPEGRTMTTMRFKKAATELLVTERYIDKDESFYQLADDCLTWVDILNERLSTWASVGAADTTEKYLLKKREKEPTELITKLQAEVMRARDEMSKRF